MHRIIGLLKNSIRRGESIMLGNPARSLIRDARRLIIAAGRESGYEQISRELAEAAADEKMRRNLREIAEWHHRQAVAKLTEAVGLLGRAERCALTARYRRYASVLLRKHERSLKSLQETTTADDQETNASGLSGFLRAATNKAAMVFSLF